MDMEVSRRTIQKRARPATKRLWVISVALASGAMLAVLIWYQKTRLHSLDAFRTAPLTRGSVVKSIVVTGSLNPVSVVSVGTQISGQISRILTNYNERITAGQLMAEIDPAIYQAAVKQSRAQLLSAQAALEHSKQIERRRATLFADGLISQQDLDEAVQKRIEAEAAASIANAQLSKDLSNLGYTKIYAPVSGVVLSQDVVVGQTVVASFETPILFKIAEDLRRMQILCVVPQTEIGAIKSDQRVTFTVDAFPDRQFAGAVRQVRLDPQIEDGMVTYTVIVDAPNPDRTLMPGMTALVRIVVDERDGVLRAPLAALSHHSSPNSEPSATHSTLRVLVDDGVKSIPVILGLIGDEEVEIVSGPVRVGDHVVVGRNGSASAGPQGS